MRYNTCPNGHADQNSLDGMEQLSRCKHVTFLELARIPPAISEENYSAIERYIEYKKYGRKKMYKDGVAESSYDTLYIIHLLSIFHFILFHCLVLSRVLKMS